MTDTTPEIVNREVVEASHTGDSAMASSARVAPPSSFTASEQVSACGQSGEWEHALRQLQLDEVNEDGVTPDISTYSAAIRECNKWDGDWRRARELFFELVQKHRLTRDGMPVVTWKAAISACTKASEVAGEENRTAEARAADDAAQELIDWWGLPGESAQNAYFLCVTPEQKEEAQAEVGGEVGGEPRPPNAPWPFRVTPLLGDEWVPWPNGNTDNWASQTPGSFCDIRNCPCQSAGDYVYWVEWQEDGVNGEYAMFCKHHRRSMETREERMWKWMEDTCRARREAEAKAEAD